MSYNDQTARSVQTGYFALAHRNAVISHDRKRLNDYIARFKHALLFTPRIVLLDHMVVNSPNFRTAYRTDGSFKEFISKDFVEIAHFELHKDGSYKTLVELREFYKKGKGLFDSRLPRVFQGDKLDSELETIQASVQRRFPPSATRDVLFTKFALDARNKGNLKTVLGDLYESYETAYNRMLQDNPTLGIIHFDAEHRSVEDDNIFDYMARLSSMRASRWELIKRFGSDVAQAHRTMLIRAETELLGAQAILPADLIKYRTLVLKAADRRMIDETGRETQVVPIDLSPVGSRALVSLSPKEIDDLRGSDCGKEYFALMDAETISFDDLVRVLHQYTHFINKTLGYVDECSRPRADQIREHLGRWYDKVSEDGLKDGRIATIVYNIGLLCNYVLTVLSPVPPVSLLVYVAKHANEQLRTWSLAEHSLTNDVKASIVLYKEVEHLTQYDQL